MWKAIWRRLPRGVKVKGERAKDKGERAKGKGLEELVKGERAKGKGLIELMKSKRAKSRIRSIPFFTFYLSRLMRKI
jgi:hypothetical protein